MKTSILKGSIPQEVENKKDRLYNCPSLLWGSDIGRGTQAEPDGALELGRQSWSPGKLCG